MKCPKCRSEVANQQVCPYCGATVYVTNTTWPVDRRNYTAPVPQFGNRQAQEHRGVERKLRLLETKANLILVLQGGCFLLILLALIILALK